MASVTEEKLVIDIDTPVSEKVTDSDSVLSETPSNTDKEIPGEDGTKVEKSIALSPGQGGNPTGGGLQSANPESVNTQPPKEDSIMTKDERHSIGEDLKKSMRDLGRIPYLLILPIINLIQGQYEKIPESRRQGFGRMAKEVKESGKGGLQKIKEWWAKKDEKKETEGTNVTEDSKGEVLQVSKEPREKKSVNEASTTANLISDIGQPKTSDGQPLQSTINVETDSGKQLKVTTTIIEEKKKS